MGKQLTFGSLFAGIGGFDLGFERAGMKCLWQVEIDSFCNRVLEKHWPNVKRYGDVREVGKHNLEPVDVICGGFPCQPHSISGQRLGASDNRNLWPEYRRIVEELRPPWVIGENVYGIATTILGGVLSDLESLDYEAIALSIPASAFGAQHQRKRIFIIANSEGERLAERIGEQEGNIREVKREEVQGKYGLARLHGPEYNWGRDWPSESILLRRLHGIPDRVDRVKSLGNAVVPQVSEWIGRRIVQLYE